MLLHLAPKPWPQNFKLTQANFKPRGMGFGTGSYNIEKILKKSLETFISGKILKRGGHGRTGQLVDLY